MRENREIGRMKVPQYTKTIAILTTVQGHVVAFGHLLDICSMGVSLMTSRIDSEATDDLTLTLVFDDGNMAEVEGCSIKNVSLEDGGTAEYQHIRVGVLTQKRDDIFNDALIKSIC